MQDMQGVFLVFVSSQWVFLGGWQFPPTSCDSGIQAPSSLALSFSLLSFPGIYVLMGSGGRKGQGMEDFVQEILWASWKWYFCSQSIRWPDLNHMAWTYQQGEMRKVSQCVLGKLCGEQLASLC